MVPTRIHNIAKDISVCGFWGNLSFYQLILWYFNIGPCNHFVVFPFKHVLLGIKFVIAVLIPDVPGWIKEEFAKKEYERKQALIVRNIQIFNLPFVDFIIDGYIDVVIF